MEISDGIRLDQGSGKERFPALTGVRAIAAFMVFSHHLQLNLKPNWLVGLQHTFYWGVTLFFVLSGFLITYQYYEHAALSGRWMRTYFTNRFARIYPVYFLVLTAVILLSGNFNPLYLLQNYTLSQNLFFLIPSHGVAIDPSWSLTVEGCFYLLAPFVFLLCRRYKLRVPFLLHLVLLGLVLLTYGHDTSLPNDMSLQHTIFPILFGTYFGHLLEFFSGIYLALIILKKEKAKPGKEKSERRLTASGSKRTIIGIAGICVLMIPLIFATKRDTATQESIMIVVNNFLLPLPIALFYYGLVCENSLLRRILSGRLMGLLGRSSYAFYLLHVPVIDYLGNAHLRKYFNDAHYNLYVMTMLSITIILSVVIFLFFEGPLNHLIRGNMQKLTIGEPA
jgi:peptidoglycan/LPS O-acetylase OafA/YrhL